MGIIGGDKPVDFTAFLGEILPARYHLMIIIIESKRSDAISKT
jgi:hypothetical protein